MSKANPQQIDYNKDTVVDQYDDELARMDKDKDGTVTTEERRQYSRKQRETTTEYEYDAEGNIISQKTTGPDTTTEPALTAEGYGYSEQFLSEHKDVRDAIRLAIENDWPQEVLNRYIESKTKFGQDTTDKQAAFDVTFASEKNEDLKQQIADREATIRKQVAMSGVQISDEEIAKFAKESVRSGFTDNDTLAFISGRFQMPTAAEGQAQAAVTGTAGDIVEELRNLARSYGITMTESDIQKKAREALNMGGDWRSYIDGQRDVFRQQAKTLYPKISDLLDTSDLSTIMNPYLSDASELLGINMAQMQITDPLWQTALNGENGPLSRDEWMRTLRTDTRFGYDRTVRARNEYTDLADELLAAFGMA